MKALTAILLFIFLALAGGCATNLNQATPLSQKGPPPHPESSLKPARPATGSLFHEARADLFTDLTARRVGDIIIVEIAENARANKKNDTKAERKNTFKAGIGALMGYENDFPPQKGAVPADGTRVSADFQSKHDAKAELSREDSMTASIGCTVLEVMPNGNMIIRGSREILVNGETQYIVLQGTVRPSDVTTSNTVLSTQLANARIHYTGRGVLTDKQKPGWLARILDHIWPF